MKKFIALLMAAAMVFAMVACNSNTNTPDIDVQTPAPVDSPVTPSEPVTPDTPVDVEYVRGDDEEKYQAALGEYEELMATAKAAATNDERFMLYAQAEAHLLESAVMIPNTTQGGAYTISRVAYRTIPYVQWGNDDDRLKSMVISDEFITKEERAELVAAWEAALAGGPAYDPAAILTSKGHTLQQDYTTTFQTAPVTIDWLNTSSQSDTEITVNCVDGLVEYDNLGNMQPALAESWESRINDDGTETYTFHIRKGVNWYTSEGTKYAEVTAHDFVAGFHHMLDTQAGLEWLIDGVVVGGTNYYANGGSWDEVGYKAIDDYTLEITLEKPISYFMTMLTYSCFLPICDSFYQSHGGVYGVEEYATASADTNTYTFGKSEDVASQVYCGPFLLQKLQKDSEIYIVKNKEYYGADKVTLNSIKWVFDNGENPDALYNDAVAGTYAGVALTVSSGLLDKAKADGNFDKYSYVSDTTSTTYFGGLNIKHFRQAMQYAFDKATGNATSRGEELACTNLRNMYTHPEFVKLENEVTDKDGHTFPAGTLYGDMVQYYCEQYGMPIDVHDGIDGWYHPEEAKAALEAAKAELGDSVTYPIYIDVVYYSASDAETAQANAYKSVIEGTLGAENVVVNLVEATTPEDYYASGYRASNGEAGNYDMFYGSGWGPDFGDPCTYLDTFLGEGAGYMTKVIGVF